MASRKPLPDRWDFEKWRNGSRVNPPKGHQVGVYWGTFLSLEYSLRVIRGEVIQARNDLKADPSYDFDNSKGEFHSADLALSEALENIVFLEEVLKSLRTETQLPARCECGQINPSGTICSCGISELKDRNDGARTKERSKDDDDPNIPF